MGRAPCCDKANVKKGPWSPEEDVKLKSYIEQNGTGGNWIALPQKIGLRRCGKSCRLRWLNYLRPNIKHGGFTEEEDRMICSLYVSIGSRWSIIAAQLPGRTDNDIKNYWNTKLKKKLFGKQLKASRGSSSLKQENIMLEYSTNNNNTYCPEVPLMPPMSFSNQNQNYSQQTSFSSLLNSLGGPRGPFSAEKSIQEGTYLRSSMNALNEIGGAECSMQTQYYMDRPNFTDLLVQNSFPGNNVEEILYSMPQKTRGQILYEADVDCHRSVALSSGETINLVEMCSLINVPLASNCGTTEQEMLQGSNFNDTIHHGVQ